MGLLCHSAGMQQIWVAQILRYSRWPTGGFSIAEKSRRIFRMASAQGELKNLLPSLGQCGRLLKFHLGSILATDFFPVSFTEYNMNRGK